MDEQKKSTKSKRGNRSLFLFSEENAFRQCLIKLEKSKYFTNSILILIILTSVTLAFENPLTDPDSIMAQILTVIDIITTIIFTVEVIIKVIGAGLLFNGKESYLYTFWNILDFIVVVISIMSLTLPQDGSSLATLKILRMGRLFRPLRVISRNEGLRVSIQALIVSFPAIIRLLMIVGLFFVIFAIMGVTLFKGEFQECNTSRILGLTN